jgi:hypothetical protein
MLCGFGSKIVSYAVGYRIFPCNENGQLRLPHQLRQLRYVGCELVMLFAHCELHKVLGRRFGLRGISIRPALANLSGAQGRLQ